MCVFRKYKLPPSLLSSGDIVADISDGATANEISVGGTFISVPVSLSLNVPDILSLPPIAPSPSLTCASIAPSSAANGLPQRFGSVPSRSKYSWKDNLISLNLPPLATTFATDSITAYIAP